MADINRLVADLAAQNDRLHLDVPGRQEASKRLADAVASVFRDRSRVFAVDTHDESDGTFRVIVKAKTWIGSEEVPVAGLTIPSLVAYEETASLEVADHEFDWAKIENIKYDAGRREWIGAQEAVLRYFEKSIHAWMLTRENR